jgi:arginine/serine-rich splicing factor 1/9
MEVLELFEKFGKICFADLKGGRTGPPFAFIEYEDYRDAEDAISQRDGYKFDGCRLRVEFPKGEMRGRGGAYVGNGGGRGYNNYNNDYGNGNNNRRFQQRRSQYRLQVSGLPPGSSWQDLKDHMREVGEVCYAEVRKDGSGTGIVEFLHIDDMKEAIRKLNDTQLRSHEGSAAYIRLKDYDNRSDSRSRSYSPKQRESRRRRSPTRSRSRSSGEDKQAAMAKPEGKRPRGRSGSRS